MCHEAFSFKILVTKSEQSPVLIYDTLKLAQIKQMFQLTLDPQLVSHEIVNNGIHRRITGITIFTLKLFVSLLSEISPLRCHKNGVYRKLTFLGVRLFL